MLQDLKANPLPARASQPKRALVACVGLLLALVGCRDLERFDTKDGSAYCGSMISLSEFQEGFSRAGQPPTLELELELDMDQLTTRPGALRTNDANEPNALCGTQGLPLLNAAELRPINELFHDPLSTLEFGEGREYNFFAWVDSTCKGTLLSVVSLMKNDKVEVRLFKPAGAPLTTTPREDKPGFALFHLSRHPAACF